MGGSWSLLHSSIVDLQDHSTALHLACGSGDFAISSLLLEHGANVNQENKVFSFCILSWIIQERRDASRLSMLDWECFSRLTSVRPNFENSGYLAILSRLKGLKDHLTLLHSACQSESVATVSLLLERGVSVNINYQNKVLIRKQRIVMIHFH